MCLYIRDDVSKSDPASCSVSCLFFSVCLLWKSYYNFYLDYDEICSWITMELTALVHRQWKRALVPFNWELSAFMKIIKLDDIVWETILKRRGIAVAVPMGVTLNFLPFCGHLWKMRVAHQNAAELLSLVCFRQDSSRSECAVCFGSRRRRGNNWKFPIESEMAPIEGYNKTRIKLQPSSHQSWNERQQQ